jgi:hypothetical protein
MTQLTFIGDTLAEAREMVLAHKDDGIECPCCAQLVKRYWRAIYHMQVVRLVKMYRMNEANPGGYVTIGLLDRSGGEVNTTKHWGLVEPEELTREEKDALGRPSRGRWRLTEKGQAFVREEIRVPKYALVYNDELEGFEGPEVGVRECLKDNFDYTELWHGPSEAA